MSSLEARLRPHASLLPVAVGACWLVLRPSLVTAGATALTLAIGYAVIAGAALAVPVDPVGPAVIPRPVALAVGLVAVTTAAARAGFALSAAPRTSSLVLTLFAAVSEELVFRRALYGWLARHGAAVAVVGSAALFAVVHVPAYGLAALPVDLGAGLLFSWQRWATGSWGVPALTHLSANALAVML